MATICNLSDGRSSALLHPSISQEPEDFDAFSRRQSNHSPVPKGVNPGKPVFPPSTYHVTARLWLTKEVI